MRITLQGVQGSGSTFMRLQERETARAVTESRLLERVLQFMSDAADDGSQSVEDLLQGKMSKAAVRKFRDRFAGEPPVSYGGWTTCVQVETADGLDLVFDCGSGFRNCANDLQKKWGERDHRSVHVFGSHSHRDHTEGFDQATVCFDPRNEIHIYGNRQFLFALDDQLGIFSRKVAPDQLGVHTPLYFELMPAGFACHPIVTGDETVDGLMSEVKGDTYFVDRPIELGDATTVTPFRLYHPAPCLGYRVESAGAVFVFATDHELRHGDGHEQDRLSQEAEDRLCRYSENVDLLYRDGQYMIPEYYGEKGIGDSCPLPRIGWGHSCIEDVQDMAVKCGVRHTLVGHHDPNREWPERQWMEKALERNVRNTGLRMELAKAESVIVI